MGWFRSSREAWRCLWQGNCHRARSGGTRKNGRSEIYAPRADVARRGDHRRRARFCRPRAMSMESSMESSSLLERSRVAMMEHSRIALVALRDGTIAQLDADTQAPAPQAAQDGGGRAVHRLCRVSGEASASAHVRRGDARAGLADHVPGRRDRHPGVRRPADQLQQDDVDPGAAAGRVDHLRPADGVLPGRPGRGHDRQRRTRRASSSAKGRGWR